MGASFLIYRKSEAQRIIAPFGLGCVRRTAYFSSVP